MISKVSAVGASKVRSDGPNAIVTHQLGRMYGGEWVVSRLNLTVPKGAVLGFLGLNGAGKSTTIRMLMGLVEPHTGSCEVVGIDPVRDPVGVKREVGYVPDTPTFYEWMTARETLAFAGGYRPGRWSQDRAMELLADFGVEPDRAVKNLSKGQRAKVGLVLALAFRPELLLLDEPTLGLDPVARRQFVEGVLSEFAVEERTVLISSHQITEISGLVDRVAILHQGRLLTEEATEAFTGRMKRVRLTFEDDTTRDLACPGMLRSTFSGRDALLVMDHWDAATSPGHLASLGAKSMHVEDLGLEEAFVALVGGLDSDKKESQS